MSLSKPFHVKTKKTMWPIIRSILFLLPPETTHDLAKFGMKWMSKLLPLRIDALNNPIGLAAGFDKNAEIIKYLPYFGFGSVEIGTVTPKPQDGNEKPRLFRIAKDKTLFNRMGFNNLGAVIVSERVRRAKPHLPGGFKVGVNLGKNKLTTGTDAALDYAKVADQFLDCADYFVINVSSPNTPGLRALQNPESLKKIVSLVQLSVAKAPADIPIYVKLAPEIDLAELKLIIKMLEEMKIAGLVLTNTESSVYIYREKALTGGLSGQNLSSTSLKRLIEARSITSLPIISVGGIMNEEDAVQRLKMGATAIQIYTGWIYAGPFFAKRILKRLRQKI